MTGQAARTSSRQLSSWSSVASTCPDATARAASRSADALEARTAFCGSVVDSRRDDERDVGRPAGLGDGAVHLDHAVAHRRQLVLDERDRARDVAAGRGGRQRRASRCARNVISSLAIAIVLAWRCVCAALEDLVHRRAEPARGDCR